MAAQSDLVLLASFLQNQQQEKANKSFRLVHDLFNGKGDPSLLTKNLELSLSELKDAQLENLRDVWHHTVYPSQSLGINTTRRPAKRLPPTHVTVETGANYGIDPFTGIARNTPSCTRLPFKILKKFMMS